MTAVETATLKQKSIMFEFLRNKALEVNNPDWFQYALALHELARLNALKQNEIIEWIAGQTRIQSLKLQWCLTDVQIRALKGTYPGKTA